MEFALFLDFDGTIVNGASWDAVRAYYGIDPEDWFERFSRGEVGLDEWYEHDLMRILPLVRDRDIRSITEKLKKVRGFDDFARDYFPRFAEVAILSGGFPHVLEKFAQAYGMKVHGPTYMVEGDRFVEGAPMGGENKKKVLEREARKRFIVYVADDPLPGYEKDDYGPGVLRVCMGDGEHEHVVHDFHELGGLLDKVLAGPGKYFG